MSKVCAVLPHYDQNEFIAEAYDSVLDQVDQICVVDDGSPAPTALADLVLTPNGGAAAAINAGMEWLEEHGIEDRDWLTWVSADNTYEPGAFAALVAEAEKANAVAAYSGFWYEEPGAARRYLYTPHTWKELISREDCYYGPCFIIRADFWLPHRGGINHDYDNWLRVEEKIYEAGQKIVGLDRALCHYRAHPKRATVVKAHEYHADKVRAEAIERRTRLGLTALLP